DRPIGRDQPDAMVERIGDEETPTRREGDRVRKAKLGALGRAAVTRVSGHPRPGDRAERSVRGVAPHGGIERLGEDESSLGGGREPARVADLGGGGGAAVAGEAGDPRPDDRCDRPVKPQGKRRRTEDERGGDHDADDPTSHHTRSLWAVTRSCAPSAGPNKSSRRAPRGPMYTSLSGPR